MDSIIESWTCQIETDVATFFEALNADSTATWIHSRIGHRSPGCKPSMGKMGAAFIFTGDAGNLAAISARMYRPGWLTVVIERYSTEPEELDPDYATWAEVGATVTTWLRGWVQEHYGVEPVKQSIGLPSWDEYDEAPTPGESETAQKVGERGAVPIPGVNGATWDDTFTWYAANRDTCRTLRDLAGCINAAYGTVKNKHAEYRAQYGDIKKKSFKK